ncbi:MAG: hypothetical protein BWY69_01214 [Planctomycetes bacterium ADurb.Bin401]|nr:MAG: hypothetical protein BWY69_01214 [Planctomycetes bacterium ADurb.Bin401]
MIRAKIFGHYIRIVADDFAGIENIFGVKYFFEVFEDIAIFLSEMFFHKGGVNQAIGMFAAERASERESKRKNFFGDVSHFFQIGRIGQVKIRANMNFAVACVAVVNHIDMELFANFLQAGKILG